MKSERKTEQTSQRLSWDHHKDCQHKESNRFAKLWKYVWQSDLSLLKEEIRKKQLKMKISYLFLKILAALRSDDKRNNHKTELFLVQFWPGANFGT